MNELIGLQNQKVELKNDLLNLEDKIIEVETLEKENREKELNFFKEQNENLESFLEAISKFSDPFQIKSELANQISS